MASESTNLPPGVTAVPYDEAVFRPDPSYATTVYDPQAQLDIYGGKRVVKTTRPMIELGRELYRQGPFQPGLPIVGKKNLVFAHLLVSGDWRNAVAYNDVGSEEISIAATRLNLDVDLKLTATERIHAFFRPLDKDNKFTSYTFCPDQDGDFRIDGEPEALFFEGDMGAIWSGLSGTDARFDLPFTFGLIPLLFQNGVWMEDAFTGFAFSIPARNSRRLNWSNFDITFFAGFDKITSPTFVRSDGDLADSSVNIYGVTTFIEANKGYWEAGYAYLHDDRSSGPDASYHNFTVAFTRRYFDRISNSLRIIANVGQDDDVPSGQSANGVIFLIENSLVTSLPSTLVPYFNLFVGIDHPQSAARDAGAGGILKNTGILFETDGLTGFPTLDATGNDTYGAALGLEYLFNLDQQIVVEVATAQIMGDENKSSRSAAGSQYGVGVRYQRPLSESWILRADAMYGWRNADSDISGARVEIRYKF